MALNLLARNAYPLAKMVPLNDTKPAMEDAAPTTSMLHKILGEKSTYLYRMFDGDLRLLFAGA